jgi:ethanolamine utilization protein EutM
MFEVQGFTPGLVALDCMEKSARIAVHQAELNDFLGVVIKISGTPADIEVALEAGTHAAEQMGVAPIAGMVMRPDDRAWTVISTRREFNPLIQQDVVIFPHLDRANKELGVIDQSSFALGFIETQGFTAVFEAIDSACKAAAVDVIGKEKLGGGYVTVVIKGDVAAVKAAVEAGKSQVEGLGKLIAAHVIARPSPAVLALLPAG